MSPHAKTQAGGPLSWHATRRILLAEDPSACRQAIAGALDDLMTVYGYAMQIAELGVRLSQDMRIAWTAGDGSLGMLEEGPLLRAWLARARQHMGQALSFDGRTSALLVAAGEDEMPLYLLFRVENDSLHESHLTAIFSDFAESAVRQLHRLRRDAELRLVKERVRSGTEHFLSLLRTNVDLVWEAGPDDIVHVTHVFNGRSDLVPHIDRVRLKDIPFSAQQTPPQWPDVHGPARNLRLAKSDAAGNALYLSAAPKPGGTGICGSLAAGPDLSGDLLAIDAQIVETMLGAKLRETQARREAEGMLLGLRILLAQASFHEKIRNLAEQLAIMVDCDTVEVIHNRAGSKPRLLGAEALSPYGTASLCRAVADISADRVQILKADCDTAAALQSVTKLSRRDIGLVTLSCGAEQYLFLLQGRSAFGSRELGIMDRFSLLLEQALLLRNDQDQMIHAAKLSALGQMSTGIAHELRQPLNTISIAAQNLILAAENGAADPAFVLERMERILRQVERACAVMDRMRRFGRKGAGDYIPCSLADLAHSARALILSALEKNDIQIVVAIPENTVVLACDIEVEQILVNLLQNACDALAEQRPAAPPQVRIWTRPDEDSEMVRVHVQDNGPGFPPDVLKHALDAFFSTKPADKGTGLGLSISHTIMREHGGRMEIGNAENGGGLITLFFRRPDADTVSRVIPLHRRGAAATHVRKGKPHA